MTTWMLYAVMCVVVIYFYATAQSAKRDAEYQRWLQKYSYVYNQLLRKFLLKHASPQWEAARLFHRQEYDLLMDEIERYSTAPTVREKAKATITDRFHHLDSSLERKARL